MKKFSTYAAVAFLSVSFLFVSCKEEKTADSTKEGYAWKTKKSGDYEYKYVENDPSHARFYTLDNGLTVILSPSKKKPRIQTFMAVKAGSKTDPAEHTGLAHYLEHMLFKGTDKYGSYDWEKEEPLLEEIEKLYEEYNSTTDDAKRKEIYKKIDETSGEAAKYAIANEYDKLMSGMGAQGTNAFTSFEETVYTEDIPSNVIDKYLRVQGERFRNPVFRLFHTELEAVYEEKNRSLDSDGSKVFEEIFKQLFPNHNYGKQTTIGTVEHLKNPSLIEIRNYFDNYYVPNNMGIIMAGDFDPDEVIKEIDKNFSWMESKEIPEYEFEKETDLTEPVTAEVFGPEPENIMLGYRFPGVESDDSMMLTLVGEILTNGSAGLIDLDLVKKQKLLGAFAFPYVLRDYSILLLGGNPTADQDLDEVKELLLSAINKLKEGDFSDDLITSIINNEKKSALRTNEEYGNRAYELLDNFIAGDDWLRHVEYVDWLGNVDKQDIVDFANNYFKDNYVAVYKRQGEDKSVAKVEKPQITPVEVNREAQSDFLQEIAEMEENVINPIWLDYDKDINRADAGKYKVLAVQNEDNGLFQMDYYFDTGSWSKRKLALASGYLDYLGTEEKSAEDISTGFYKLASSFNLRVTGENTYLSVNGLQENFEETITMIDDLLKNSVVDEEALKSYISRLKKRRANAKENKSQIMEGLRNYALYGEENPFNQVLSDDELDEVTAEELVEIIHDLLDYEHKILYYGPESASEIAKVIEEHHPAPEEFKSLPEPVRFEQKSQEESKVLLANYDMVQAETFWLRNAEKYDADKVPMISLFNQYFGGGMESVVFQTIRESKALAYSSYAVFSNPAKKEDRGTFRAYVGTQSDKFVEAVDGMNELLNDLPKSEKAVENSKTSLKKQLATQRISGMNIIYNYLSAQKLGNSEDLRKKTYEEVPKLEFEDLQKFHEDEIKDQTYFYTIVAGKGRLDEGKLKEMGEVKRLSLEEIFGY